MSYWALDDIIFACSTSQASSSALSVIRFSGKFSLSDFDVYFPQSLQNIISRKVYLRQLEYRGKILDQVCVTYFQGPHSYTGENVLELSVHGNPFNVDRILKIFSENPSFRLAGPGEFTFRALKNKKQDLAQVEGLDLLLNAQSEFALGQGLELMSGQLHQSYTELYDAFLMHKSALELGVDFLDDVGEEGFQKQFNQTLVVLNEKLTVLYKRISERGSDLIKPTIVITGQPNAGKSSLFNLLLQENRSIVSPQPGTTRDYISESINILGVSYKLLDTAGIRESNESIEAEGISRAEALLESAFFRILLINPIETDKTHLSRMLQKTYDLILLTHADLSGFKQKLETISELIPSSTLTVVLSGQNQELASKIATHVNKKYLGEIKQNPVLLDRHKLLISQAYNQACKYNVFTKNQSDIAILSHELSMVGNCLSELVGIVSPDEILNSIFSRFCIGK